MLLATLFENFRNLLHLKNFVKFFFYINKTDQSLLLLSERNDYIGRFPIILCPPFWSTLPPTQNGTKMKHKYTIHPIRK